MIIEIDEDEAALLVLALVTQINSAPNNTAFEPDMTKLLAKLLLHEEVRSTLMLYSMDGRDS